MIILFLILSVPIYYVSQHITIICKTVENEDNKESLDCCKMALRNG